MSLGDIEVLVEILVQKKFQTGKQYRILADNPIGISELRKNDIIRIVNIEGAIGGTFKFIIEKGRHQGPDSLHYNWSIRFMHLFELLNRSFPFKRFIL